jgi:hypothetical protein
MEEVTAHPTLHRRQDVGEGLPVGVVAVDSQLGQGDLDRELGRRGIQRTKRF